MDEAVAAVTLARSYVEDVEFSAEDATRTDWDYLEEVSKAVVAAGARTVNLPDTVGFSVPDEYGALIARMSKALGNTAIVSVHCHDDLGLAVANSLAAIQNGARQVECTINGIGERAGNAALEEIVMAINTRRDRYPYETKIVTEHLYPASQLLTSIITFGPQPNKAIVGENAFAHEAGIHQDGYLKERTTYEIMDPHSVGVPESKLILGKHSGRHALTQRCETLGFDLTPRAVRRRIPALHHAGRSQERHEKRRNFRDSARSAGRKQNRPRHLEQPNNEPKNPNPTRRRYRRRSDQCGRRSPQSRSQKIRSHS